MPKPRSKTLTPEQKQFVEFFNEYKYFSLKATTAYKNALFAANFVNASAIDYAGDLETFDKIKSRIAMLEMAISEFNGISEKLVYYFNLLVQTHDTLEIREDQLQGSDDFQIYLRSFRSMSKQKREKGSSAVITPNDFIQFFAAKAAELPALKSRFEERYAEFKEAQLSQATVAPDQPSIEDLEAGQSIPPVRIEDIPSHPNFPNYVRLPEFPPGASVITLFNSIQQHEEDTYGPLPDVIDTSDDSVQVSTSPDSPYSGLPIFIDVNPTQADTASVRNIASVGQESDATSVLSFPETSPTTANPSPVSVPLEDAAGAAVVSPQPAEIRPFLSHRKTGDKVGGVNSSGYFGAWYLNEITGDEGLAKKEKNVAKTMMEVFGAQLVTAVTDYAAKVDFIQTTDIQPGQPDEDGENTYAFSHKVKGFKGDLWKCAYEYHNAVNEDQLEMPEDRPRRAGSSRTVKGVFRGYLEHLAEGRDDVSTQTNQVKQQFAEMMAGSLWIGDFDVHIGNLVVSEIDGKPTLFRIDYGAAFHNLNKHLEVHPHSRSRHPFGLGPTNHFREFPRTWRVSYEMVAAIEKLATVNIDEHVNLFLDKLKDAYGLDPLKLFAKRFGIKKNLIPDDKEQLLKLLKERLTISLEARKESLVRYAREIELSLCFDAENNLDLDKFKALVLKDPDYFINAIKNDSFHFRGKGQSTRKLEKIVKAEIVKPEIVQVVAKAAPEKFLNFIFELGEAVAEENQQILVDAYQQNISMTAATLHKLSLESLLAIKREDLLAARTSAKENPSSSLIQATILFNNINKFVVSNIIQCRNIDERVLAFKYWVDVAASAISEFGDYNVAFAINSAFENSAINRLKSTINSLDSATKEKYEHFKEALTSNSNYKEFRVELANSDKPVIPYFGMWMTDITFVKDGSKFPESWPTATIPEKHEKHEKYALGSKVGLWFDLVIEEQKKIIPAPHTQRTINANLLDSVTKQIYAESFDQDAYKVSLEVEPRGEELECSVLLSNSIYSSLRLPEKTQKSETTQLTWADKLEKAANEKLKQYLTAEVDPFVEQISSLIITDFKTFEGRVYIEKLRTFALKSLWDKEPTGNELFDKLLKIREFISELEKLKDVTEANRQAEFTKLLTQLKTDLNIPAESTPQVASADTLDSSPSAAQVTTSTSVIPPVPEQSFAAWELLKKIKAFHDTVAKRMEKIDGIIANKTLFGLRFTEEQKVLLDGQLTQNLHEAQRHLQRLKQDVATGSMDQGSQDTANQLLNTTDQSLTSKFQWVHGENCRKSRLDFALQFVLRTQEELKHIYAANLIGDLRQGNKDLEQIIKDIELQQLNFQIIEANLMDDKFKARYHKNEARINEIKDQLTHLHARAIGLKEEVATRIEKLSSTMTAASVAETTTEAAIGKLLHPDRLSASYAPGFYGSTSEDSRISMGNETAVPVDRSNPVTISIDYTEYATQTQTKSRHSVKLEPAPLPLISQCQAPKIEYRRFKDGTLEYDSKKTQVSPDKKVQHKNDNANIEHMIRSNLEYFRESGELKIDGGTREQQSKAAIYAKVYGLEAKILSDGKYVDYKYTSSELREAAGKRRLLIKSGFEEELHPPLTMEPGPRAAPSA